MRAPFETLPRRLRLHSLSETARRSVGGGSPYRTPPPRVPGAVRCPQSSRIKEQSAQIIISEVGLDMTKWNTEKQFCSFLGLCPNNSISGGKVLRRATRKVYNRAADTLRLCAQSLTHSKSVDLRASSSKQKREIVISTAQIDPRFAQQHTRPGRVGCVKANIR